MNTSAPIPLDNSGWLSRQQSTCRNFRHVRLNVSRQITYHYLTGDELQILNVSGSFDFAEVQAINHSMYMNDYQEYQRFLVQTPSPVEEAYLATIREAGKAARKRAREA